MNVLGTLLPPAPPLWWAEVDPTGTLRVGRVGNMWSPTSGSIWWGNYPAESEEDVLAKAHSSMVGVPGTPYLGSQGLRRPPAGAIGISAIRILPDGGMRQFSAVEFRRGWSGVERFIRTLRAVGYVRPTTAEPSYAVLDVLNADGDIIGDYDVPNTRAWRYIYRKLRLRAEPEDAS